MPEAKKIKSMFNSISPIYDLLNDILSMGVHRIWKKRLVSEAISGSPCRILDLATGTGDVALMLKRSNPNFHVTGADFSPLMLERAKKKSRGVCWEIQDATQMTYSDQYFDVSIISYGIRNIEDMSKGLKEMARVTRSKICILEFGRPHFFLPRMVYSGVMKVVMPLIGKLFRQESAYRYLIESSLKFPCRNEFCQIIREQTGFPFVRYQSFFGGITYLYIAQRTDHHLGNLSALPKATQK